MGVDGFPFSLKIYIKSKRAMKNPSTKVDGFFNEINP